MNFITHSFNIKGNRINKLVMKVCFLMLYHSSSVIGGAEVQVDYIVDYLVKNSTHQLYLICRESQINAYKNIKIYKIRFNRNIGKFFLSFDFVSITQILNKIKPDVIYTRTSTSYVGIAAIYCKINSAKLIYHIAHKEDVVPLKYNGLKSLPKMLERWIYLFGLKNASVIIGQAEYQDIALQKNYNRNCSAIIPNSHPQPVGNIKACSQLNVVWIANLKKSKQPEVFVKLAEEFQEFQKLKFFMIGAVLNDNYQGLIERIQSLVNLEFLGPQSIEEVNRILESAHVFVNTSLEGEEGFPNTFIQSWMRAVPVISLNVDPDNIIKKNCLGYHSGSFGQLKTDLQRLLEDKDLRERMGSEAKEYSNKRFGLNNIELLLRVIENLKS